MRNLIFGILMTLTISCPAAAKPAAQDEMKFTLYYSDWRPQFDLIQIVYAEGVITPGTTERFKAFLKAKKLIPGGKVMLDSPGGSLVEGMKLGQAIREAGFSTDIGKRGPKQVDNSITPDVLDMMKRMGADPNPPKTLPGACLSACSLAYLGGEFRYVTPDDSVYGVHRFSTPTAITDPLDNAQILSGVVVSYIKQMGVEPQLFTAMTMASPSEIIVIPTKDLIELKVVTGSSLKDEWVLKSIPQGMIYVVGTHVDSRGTSKMTFMCDQKSKKMLSVAYIPAGDEHGANLMLAETVDAGYFIDTQIHRLTAENNLTKQSKFNEVQAIWQVFPADIAALTSAKSSIGFALLHNTPGIFSGLRMTLDENGRSMIRNYATNCWGGL